MSASCFFNLEYKGTEEQFKPLWELLHKIEGTDTSASDDILPLYKREGNKVSTTNAEAQEIWGYDFLEPTVDLYLLMARVAKDLEFSSYSDRLYEGGGEGCSACDEVSYKNGTLVFRNQSRIDVLCIDDFLNRMLEYGIEKDYEEGHVFAVVGEMYTAPADFVKQYIIDTENEVSEELTEDVEYLIINEKEKYKDVIKKAKKLGIKIISELEFIAEFTESYVFEEELEIPVCENENVIRNLKMEDMKRCYKFAKDITEEDFEHFKNGRYAFVVTEDYKVFKEGSGNEEIYKIDEDGTVYNEDGTKNEKMTKHLAKLEKKYLSK